MVQLKDPSLRRFWFTIPGHWGIGVTAHTREDAEALARSAAQQLRWEFAPSHVAEDGVWFPLM